MTLNRLMLLSLRRFWRTNLGVLLGVALASTVVTGALLVGDSMRHTLSQTAKQRLGNIEQAVIGGDRFFTAELANGLAPNSSGIIVAEGVASTDEASTQDGKARANDIALIGIDQPFIEMMGLRRIPEAEQVVLNTQLADRLKVVAGNTVIIRIPQPSALPIDASLVNASKPALAIRVKVSGVVDDAQGGRFSLRAEQRAPLNAFVDRRWLAEQLEQPGKVNLALSAETIKPFDVKLDDLQLSLDSIPTGQSALTTPRIFIDASVEDDLAELPGQRLLTYMVNTVAKGDKQSPYAMVTASDSLGDLDLADDEIAINRWLADDIGAAVGDTLTLTYFLPDEGDRLVEATAKLTVKRIVPIEGVFADRTLTPDFPGLAEADQLSRWDAGPAIDRSRIRDKDEAYWDDYRATPKAFINLATGQRLWSNRFGTLTAIRFDNETTEVQLLDRIDPAALGLIATDIKAQADAASVGTVDFGQLFLSLSGFIIIAAIVLAAMLFAMSAEQRARQLGTLLALGLTSRQTSRLLLSEGLIVAILGSLLGVLGAIAYAIAVTNALSGVWSGAVAGSAVLLHMTATSLIAGPLATLLISLLAMTLAIRGLNRRTARELMSGGVGKVSGPAHLSFKAALGMACLFIVAAAIIALTNQQEGMQAALIGFAAGGASFVGGLLLLYALLSQRRSQLTPSSPLRWHNALSILNLTRRRERTLAAVFMLGAGLFLVFAVSGFQLSTSSDPSDRASGTGGFALLVESSQPIRYDLNTELGRDHYALSEEELPPGSIVPIRVSGGDDASCLNLNQTPTPRLLGVDPAMLAQRDAFSFFSMTRPDLATWNLLEPSHSVASAIPVIADANTAQWALKVGVGDTLTVPDEQGQPVTLQLVGTIENSILQGSLIMHEDAFEKMFPSISGYRMLLVDRSPSQDVEETSALLEEVLIDEGATVTPTNDRLAEYNRVQNTYLAVFQSLGGLGVLLGALGLGIVTARNLLERRSELALLSAVGLSRTRIARIVLTEHAAVLLLGLLLGSASAALATYHASGQTPLDAGDIAIFFAPLAAGLLAILLGLIPALRGRLTDALRND